MNSLDTFCLRGLSVVVAGFIGMLAIAAMPVEETQPVNLYHAKPVAAMNECGDDWVCVLHVEHLAKAEARQPKGRGHGYSANDRKQLNQLIARLP